MWAMPKTRALIGARGTTFQTSLVNFPLCCPSRATYYTGRYAHNHGVLWNNFPQGGYRKLRGSETLPVWLRRAGYRTIHIGKYLNEYGEDRPREVPPGWDDWYGGVDPSTYDYYGYTINHNGALKTYGRRAADYSTDVYAGLAEKAIRVASKAGKLFFLGLAPNAPHTVATEARARKEGTPALPPPRYAKRFAAGVKYVPYGGIVARSPPHGRPRLPAGADREGRRHQRGSRADHPRPRRSTGDAAGGRAVAAQGGA